MTQTRCLLIVRLCKCGVSLAKSMRGILAVVEAPQKRVPFSRPHVDDTVSPLIHPVTTYSGGMHNRNERHYGVALHCDGIVPSIASMSAVTSVGFLGARPPTQLTQGPE